MLSAEVIPNFEFTSAFSTQHSEFHRSVQHALMARKDARRSEPVGLAATLSAVTAKELKRPRSGTDRRRRGTRLRRSLGFVAEPMLYRRATNPSRRCTVRSAAEGSFSHGPKRSAKPMGSLRRCTDRRRTDSLTPYP